MLVQKHRSLSFTTLAFLLVFTFYAQPLFALCFGEISQSGSQARQPGYPLSSRDSGFLNHNGFSAKNDCKGSDCVLLGAREFVAEAYATTAIDRSSLQQQFSLANEAALDSDASYLSLASMTGTTASGPAGKPTTKVYLLNSALRR